MALVPLEEIREWWSSTNSIITLHTSLVTFFKFLFPGAERSIEHTPTEGLISLESKAIQNILYHFCYL